MSDPAAMADILASIKRIVSEEDQRHANSPLRRAPDGEILVLTRDMRVDAPAPAPSPAIAGADGPAMVAQAAPATRVKPDDAPAGAVASANVDRGVWRVAVGSDALSAAAAAKPAAEPQAASPAQQAQRGEPPEIDAAETDLGELPVDEAMIVDIARAVIREEFEGEMGTLLTQRIRALVQDEVRRALDERR